MPRVSNVPRTLGVDLASADPTTAACVVASPEELLDTIEAKGREIDAAVGELRASLARQR
jgi:hypothetical protein